MAFKPEEVSSVLQQELEKFDTKLEMKSVGSVLMVGDGIARVWGLEDAMAAFDVRLARPAAIRFGEGIRP